LNDIPRSKEIAKRIKWRRSLRISGRDETANIRMKRRMLREKRHREKIVDRIRTQRIDDKASLPKQALKWLIRRMKEEETAGGKLERENKESC